MMGKECLSWDCSWLNGCVYTVVKLKSCMLVLIQLQFDLSFSMQ